LSHPDVQPAGLVARDTLRLEAGLPLYGNDLTQWTTPTEAGLNWTISKRRKENPTFIGGEFFQMEQKAGPEIRRVGLIATGPGRVVRAGAELSLPNNITIGTISSGGFSPTLNKSIAMAYVPPQFNKLGEKFLAKVGNSNVELVATRMPFVPTKYKV
jgi:aminomethyltransferase